MSQVYIASPAKRQARGTGRKPKARAGPYSRRMAVPRMIRGSTPMPRTVTKKFTYVEAAFITLSSARGRYQFTCNGMFDPNFTGTGHQPLYYDQMMQLYNHYTVISSRAIVTVADSVNRQIQLAFYVDDDTNAENNAEYAAERPGAESFFGYLAQDQNTKLAQSWNAKATFGGNPLSQEKLQGTAGANPTELSYYTLVAYDLALNDSAIYFSIKIEYTAVLDEFVTVTAS